MTAVVVAFAVAVLAVGAGAIAPHTGRRVLRPTRSTQGVAALTATLAFIGSWEGLRLDAYRDVVGVPTICYGETKGVKLGQSRTKAQCDDMLMSRVAEFEVELDKCLTVSVPTDTKIAFVSWAYNVGSTAACKSTLVRKANAGDIAGACNELPRWNKAGGRTLKGLVNRRSAEQKLCHQGLTQG